MKVVVLAGGLSPERDVSLSSGSLIANALIENGHNVLLLDLYKGIESEGSLEHLFVDPENALKYNYLVSNQEPDLALLKLEMNMGNVLIGKNVIELCRLADLVFIALHGDVGENGKLQAIFDAYDIHYTGTGYIGSLLAMDKDISKKIMMNEKVLTPNWILWNTKDSNISQIVDAIGFPCVVKPCSCGSSVGVSIVNNANDLLDAISVAGKYEDTLLIEEMIVGREFSVGILDNKPLPIIEIIPKEGFYDYKNKYQQGFSKEICPAELSENETFKMQTLALQVHHRLRLGDYSRIDFIMCKDGSMFCLEANTLPGMTPTSLLPQEAASVGISYNELCEKIVEMARRTK